MRVQHEIVLYHRASLWHEAHGIVDGGFLFGHVDEKGTGMYASTEMDRWLGGQVQFRLRLPYSRLADFWDPDIQDAIAMYYTNGVGAVDARLDALAVDAIAHGPDLKIRPEANVTIEAFRRIGMNSGRWLHLNQRSADSRQRAHAVIGRWEDRWQLGET